MVWARRPEAASQLDEAKEDVRGCGSEVTLAAKLQNVARSAEGRRRCAAAGAPRMLFDQLDSD
jgi:hypothetical protein